jgi:hypothetical protein
MKFPTGWPTCRGPVTLSQIAGRLVVRPMARNRCDRPESLHVNRLMIEYMPIRPYWSGALVAVAD